MNYSKHVSLKKTPQTSPVLNMNMVENNAGGYVFEADPMAILDRFLILGTEGGTYYADERTLTIKTATKIIDLIATNGVEVVNRIVEISDQGRAPKNSSALFALALCTSPSFADIRTRQLAFDALPKVARISTHLFQFITFMQSVRGWGKLAKKSVQKWYQAKDPLKLEYQMVKYRQREGWTHNDVLRLAKPKPVSIEHNMLYEFAKTGDIKDPHTFRLIEGLNKIKLASTAKEAASLVYDYDLPMEAVPTQFKKEPIIWDALLPNLPITATIRNLRNMAKCGFLSQNSNASKVISRRIADKETIKKGRVHPIQFLNALINYPKGVDRTRLNGGISTIDNSGWEIVDSVVDALNAGFTLGFENIVPTGLRTLQALDVSGSMGWDFCVGSQGLTPREASAALCLITVNTEPNCMIGTFTGKFSKFDGIKKNMSINAAIKAVSSLEFGSTNLSSPIEWSIKNSVPIDVFNCYTDNETYCGTIHPFQVLKKHRNKFGIPTKFISVGMASNDFTVANPSDPNMMDVVGFDTATPKILSEFALL